MKYVPTGDDCVAVVVKPGVPVTTAEVSPLTNPRIVAVKAGFGWP